MRGKTAKKLRKLSFKKSLTHNSITFSDTVQYKLNPEIAVNGPSRGRYINIFNNADNRIFVQRKLNPVSAKSIYKKLKRFIKATPWNKISLSITSFKNLFDNDHLQAFSKLGIDYEKHEARHKEVYKL